MYTAQITQALEERSGGVLNTVFSHSVLYRLINFGYICGGLQENRLQRT